MSKLLSKYIPSKINLSTNKIDCFLFDINLFNEDLAIKLLVEDELARAAKFKPSDKRQQFVISRGLLRELLSYCLVNTSPKRIQFQYGEHGKPSTHYTQLDKKIEFNLSHTDHYVMIGLTLENQLGVDIETVSARTDHAALAKRFFSKNEQNNLAELPEDDRIDAFFRCWTRKEAFIKAEGSGVGFGLDKFSVTLDENMIKSTIYIKNPDDNIDWTNYSSISFKGYQDAIASNNGNLQVSNHVITN